VYILQSFKNQSLYIGYSSDLRNRVTSHNEGRNKATKPFIPYRLIFYEAFLNEKDAKNREEYLKGGYGRKTINKMLKNYIKANTLNLVGEHKRVREIKKGS
jgi:putative endonuclease